MAKQRKETARARAKDLIKAYTATGFNQSELARQKGVSQSAINQRLNSPIVQQTFAEIMDKNGLEDEMLVKKLKEGLEATKVISAFVIVKPDKDGEGNEAGMDSPNPEVRSMNADGKTVDFIDIPDYRTRHLYLHTALEAKKIIKPPANGGGMQVSAVIFNIGNPSMILSPAEQELINGHAADPG